MEDERISHLELELGEIRAQNQTIMLQLDELLQEKKGRTTTQTGPRVAPMGSLKDQVPEKTIIKPSPPPVWCRLPG